MQPGHNVMTTDTVVGTYNHVCIWEGIGARKKLYIHHAYPNLFQIQLLLEIVNLLLVRL